MGGGLGCKSEEPPPPEEGGRSAWWKCPHNRPQNMVQVRKKRPREWGIRGWALEASSSTSSSWRVFWERHIDCNVWGSCGERRLDGPNTIRMSGTEAKGKEGGSHSNPVFHNGWYALYMAQDPFVCGWLAEQSMGSPLKKIRHHQVWVRIIEIAQWSRATVMPNSVALIPKLFHACRNGWKFKSGS